jgi:hypothetical protein
MDTVLYVRRIGRGRVTQRKPRGPWAYAESGRPEAPIQPFALPTGRCVWGFVSGCRRMGMVRNLDGALRHSRTGARCGRRLLLFRPRSAHSSPSNDHTVTTAFHFPWWLMLAPVFRLTDGPTAVRTAVALLLAAHIVTGVVIWRFSASASLAQRRKVTADGAPSERRMSGHRHSYYRLLEISAATAEFGGRLARRVQMACDTEAR